MNRLLLIAAFAAALPVAALAQEDAGSTTDKREDPPAPASGAPAPSAAPDAHGHGPGDGHGHGPGDGHGHGPGDGHGHGGGDPHGGGMAGSGGGAPQGPAAAPTTPGKDGKQVVDIGELTFEIPGTWKSEPPKSNMRKAQVRIPKADGDPEDGEISISFFPGGGGGIEPNVQRWYGQMETADGKPVDEVAKREKLKAGEFDAVLINIPGTLKASSMPGMGPSEDRKNWRMVAGIVSAKNGPWFFKSTGPDKTMAAAVDAFKAMLQSVKAK
jgi:hypothetical protein